MDASIGGIGWSIGSLTAARALGSAALLALVPGLTACSDDFGSCQGTRTCGDGTPDAANGSGGEAAAAGGAAGRESGETANGGTPGTGGTADATDATDAGAAPDAVAEPDAGAEAPGTDAGPPEPGVDSGAIDGSPDAGPPPCTPEHTDADADNCGACGAACSGTGVSERTCTDGVCTPHCATGHADCDRSGANGCEIDVRTNAGHCGSCDVTCSSAGGKGTCVNGVCKTVCDATHADCNGDPKDGCEVDIGADAKNCGACGYTCSTAGSSGAPRCDAGSCAPSCAAGRGDCTRPFPAADDGCESDLTTSEAACGACGHDCLGGRCSASACQPFDIVCGDPALGPSFAVDGSFVYSQFSFSDVPRVARTALTGGPSATVAEVVTTNLVGDGQYLYWVDNANPAHLVRAVGKSGAQVPLAESTALTGALALAVDGSYVYWATPSRTITDAIDIDRASKTQPGIVFTLRTVPSTLPRDAPGSRGNRFGVFGEYVYFGFDGGFEFVPKVGTAMREFIGTRAAPFASDGASVYFVTSLDSGFPGLFHVPVGVSAVDRMVPVLPGMPFDGAALAVDRTEIFSTAGNNRIFRTPKAGGTQKLVAQGEYGFVDQLVPHAEGKGRALYWTTSDHDTGITCIQKIAL